MTTTKYPLAILAGLSLVGALAGCSGAADAGPSTDNSTTGSTDQSTPESDSGAASTYKDGTYTESATYQAPSGTETVDVTITLAGDVVTAVQVAGHGTDPQAKLHQGEFADGIAAAVVGKNIDELSVDKVGGSSLTSGGFNKAVATIKSDAAA